MDYFYDIFTTFLGLESSSKRSFCPKHEQKYYRFGTTWEWV